MNKMSLTEKTTTGGYFKAKYVFNYEYIQKYKIPTKILV